MRKNNECEYPTESSEHQLGYVWAVGSEYTWTKSSILRFWHSIHQFSYQKRDCWRFQISLIWIPVVDFAPGFRNNWTWCCNYQMMRFWVQGMELAMSNSSVISLPSTCICRISPEGALPAILHITDQTLLLMFDCLLWKQKLAMTEAL